MPHASVVRDAGHEPIYQDEHFLVGQSFIDNMARGAEADCTIAVLSPAYFESEYSLSELNAALANDPLGRRGRVFPVRVAPVEIPSLEWWRAGPSSRVTRPTGPSKPSVGAKKPATSSSIDQEP
jgi:hypothetical protein